MYDIAKLLILFKTNPMALFLMAARKASAMLNMHITGINFREAITQMDEFETEQKKNLRQKYSRSNKDVFARIHRPIDKIFTARGGSVIYNLQETQKKAFTSFLANIADGLSLRKWIKMVALPAYQIDPNGLIFMEISEDGQPIPCYKSTGEIFYYKKSGRKVSLVILHLTAEQAKKYINDLPESSAILLDRVNKAPQNTKYFRVVDDVTDRIVEWDGSTLTEVPGMTLPNYFMECPAMIVSDIVTFNSKLFESPDSILVELANDILTDQSTFNIWKKLHMFPKHWRVRSTCPTCMGTGKNSGQNCIDCTGTGYAKRSSVRDELVIPLPDGSDGKLSLPTQFSGYSTPEIDAWTLSTDELDRIYETMYATMWGNPPKKISQGKSTSEKSSSAPQTATAEILDVQSMIDRQKDFSGWGESIEIFITEMSGAYMFGSAWGGCSIHWGDRYINEGPDAIWNKYCDARVKGAPKDALDNLLRDYYESRYENNPIELGVALKLMKVEPFVHLTEIQVQSLTTISEQDKAAKNYYSEWKSTKTGMEIIMGSEESLRAELVTYTTEKMIAVKEDQNAAAELEIKKKGSLKPAVAA